MQLWYVIIFLLLRFKTFVGKEKSRIFATSKAVIAQLVERQLPKLQVAGSRPVYRSSIHINNVDFFSNRIKPFKIEIVKVCVMSSTMEDLLKKYQKTDSYQVEEDYFNLLPDHVLSRIHAEDAEMEATMSKYQKTTSYDPEVGYFGSLSDKVMQQIRAEEQRRAFVIRRRRWITVASAAASCLLIVGLGLFVALNHPGRDLDNQIVAKNQVATPQKTILQDTTATSFEQNPQLLAHSATPVQAQPKVAKGVKRTVAKKETDNDAVSIGDFEESDLNSIDYELLDMYSDEFAMWDMYEL